MPQSLDKEQLSRNSFSFVGVYLLSIKFNMFSEEVMGDEFQGTILKICEDGQEDDGLQDPILKFWIIIADPNEWILPQLPL